MKSTNKQADWANHIPGYAVAGGGAFALGALLNELRRQQASEGQRQRQELPPNSLVIDLPKPHAGMPKAASFQKRASGMIEGLVDHTLSAGVGLPVGFMGAKFLYDKYKKNQTDQEISAANLKYLQTLQALQQKSAETNTPNVDNFCKVAADTLNKQAGVIDALMRPAKAVGGFIARHPGATAATGAGVGVGADALRHFTGQAPEPTTISGLSDTTKKLLATTAILSGLATAGGMVNASNKREKGPSLPPSAVALNYEDIPPAATLQ